MSSLFDDPAPHILVDDLVQAVVDISDGPDVIARKGDLGRVVLKGLTQDHGWSLPTVVFERTGRAYDVIPEEVIVLAEKDFATTVATTPKKPRRQALRRGVS